MCYLYLLLNFRNSYLIVAYLIFFQNDDDWTNGVDFLDSLLGIEHDSVAFDVLQQNGQLENDSLSTPAGSVVESSSCSDSGKMNRPTLEN